MNRGTGGDARNPDTGEICEAKATSNYDSDMSSFSPNERFDHLFFIRLDQREDMAYIYDLGIDSEDLKDIPVSRTETVRDQQAQGRRPRFSVIKQVINEEGLEPIGRVNLRRETAELL